MLLAEIELRRLLCLRLRPAVCIIHGHHYRCDTCGNGYCGDAKGSGGLKSANRDGRGKRRGGQKPEDSNRPLQSGHIVPRLEQLHSRQGYESDTGVQQNRLRISNGGRRAQVCYHGIQALDNVNGLYGPDCDNAGRDNLEKVLQVYVVAYPSGNSNAELHNICNNRLELFGQIRHGLLHFQRRVSTLDQLRVCLYPTVIKPL